MKRVALYFGSFNPVHKGHIALAEWIIEHKKADEVVLIVSPQNPHKEISGLAPEFNRYEMCGMACAESKYPELIKVSAVEFTLERPSYTINTLRFLSENFGHEMEFALLLGADNVERFDSWRCADEIKRDYEIIVYPRRGYEVKDMECRCEYLADAPLFDFAATDIRKAIAEGRTPSEMLSSSVIKYIEQNRLYTTDNE